MIKGNVNIDFVTSEMLKNTVYLEKNYVPDGNGLWERMGVTPPPYPVEGPVVHQTFGDKCPEWAHQIAQQFDWVNHKQVTINKIEPGCYIPPHKDTMYKIKKYLADNNIVEENQELIRVTIFLTDHELGHWINIDGKSIDNYNKGDYAFIFPNQIHTVANLGFATRYTMQVTGTTDRTKL